MQIDNGDAPCDRVPPARFCTVDADAVPEPLDGIGPPAWLWAAQRRGRGVRLTPPCP
ncbi:hypothetical protein SAMN05660324_2905 [Klenkia brasiliensis]|uniref:Uncharacterized protein n=1 Tax=Klenkia brasiliensis TaxID=333142 RepID=A0A1G7V473_9ACTN|nr:hypothetical protein SAMN05660324_2905 [Klenkia brasiliensis]